MKYPAFSFIIIAVIMVMLSIYSIRSSKRDASNTDTMRRAYDQREALDWPSVAPYAEMAGGESSLQKARWENFLAKSSGFPSVAEIVAVQIMPTSDGHTTVTLIDVDGKRCTFWLLGPLPVAHDDSKLPPNTSTSYSTEEVERPVRAIRNY